TAVHRTWLMPDGAGKASLRDPKMTLGRYSGGSVRLWRGASGKRLEEAPEGEEIVIAEGLEDGLSAVVARPALRVLVAVSLANMGGLVLPKAIGRVIILGQNDTGAGALAGRERAIANFEEQGKRVALALSPVGKDLNDLLRAPSPSSVAKASPRP